MKASIDIIGSIMAAILAFIGSIFGGSGNILLIPPSPTPIAQSDFPYFCPKQISLGGATNPFDFSYQNGGDSQATYSVNISSNDVLTKYAGSVGQFNSTSSWSWKVPKGQTVPFNFELRAIEQQNLPNNISMQVEISCIYDIGGGIIRECNGYVKRCNYNRDLSYPQSSIYNFVNGN